MNGRRFYKSSKVPVNTQNQEPSSFLDFEKNFLKDKQEIDDDLNKNYEKSESDPIKIENMLPEIKTKKLSPIFMAKTLKSPTLELTTNFNSQIMARKFVQSLRKTANLHKNVIMNANLLMNDLTYIRARKKVIRTKGKMMKIFYWLRDIFISFFCKDPLKKFLNRIAVIETIHPFERAKICWDIFVFLNTLILFFYIPFTLSFNFLSEKQKDFFEIPQIGIYLIEVLVTLNSAYIDNGLIIKNRKKILSRYLNECFLTDIVSVFSLFAKHGIFSDEEGSHSILKWLFFVRIKIFRAKFKTLKEYFSLDSKPKGNFFFLSIIYFY